MKNFQDEINSMKNNKTISDKMQNNPNNIQKEKNTQTLENKAIKCIDSENYENFQNINAIEKKCTLSKLYKNLKNDGFSFLDDENVENLHKIIGDDFKFIDNVKNSQSGEKSTRIKIEEDHKNLHLFPNILFLNNKNEEKIIDFSEKEDIKEIKNDIKLITKNENSEKTKKKENIKKEINENKVIIEQDKNIKNDNNEDINQSYLAKGWEDFSFLDQSYSVNNDQTKKQLINNSNINDTNNIINQNKWGTNRNFPITYNITNKNVIINNYNNLDNSNCLMKNMIQKNSMNSNQIFQNQYNNQYNNLQNPISQTININNIIIQNLIKQNIILQNLSNQNINNFENLNSNNTILKKITNKNNLIDINNIMLGLEKRTTIRMMNIPTHITTSELSMRIDKRFNIDPKKENRTYDYIYVPGSMKNASKNLGFAFINFVHPLHIIKFYNFYHKRNLRTDKSNKVCLITFADKQKMKSNFGDDINPYGSYLIFNDTKNHFLSLDKH